MNLGRPTSVPYRQTTKAETMQPSANEPSRAAPLASAFALRGRAKASLQGPISNSYALIATTLALIYLPVITVLFRLRLVDKTGAGLLGILSALLLGVYLVPAIFGTRGLGVISREDKAGNFLVGFVIATAFSALIAQFGERGANAVDMWQQIAMAFAPVVFYYGFRELIRQGARGAPLRLALDIYLLFVLGTLFLQISGLYSSEQYGMRRFGLLGDGVAWLASLGCIVLFAQKRWLFTVICIAFLSATGSRAPSLVTAAGIVLLVLTQPIRSQAAFFFRALAVLAMAGGALLLPTLLPVVVARFQSTNLLENDRVNTTLFTLQLFADSPIIGSGYNIQTHVYSSYFGKGGEGVNIYLVPVSTPAQILADSGLVGFAFFLGFVIVVMKAAFEVARSDITAPVNGVRDEGVHQIARAFACWLIAFIPLNQAAAYLLPNSFLGLLVLAGAGLVVGYRKSARFVPVSRTQAA